MNISASVKPAAWGAIGGAIAAMVIGFVWGGWVTGETAGTMAAESAKTEIVRAFTPLCVARARQKPDQLVRLKKVGYWERGDFVIKAGWVVNVGENYRSAVAESCAETIVDSKETTPTG